MLVWHAVHPLWGKCVISTLQSINQVALGGSCGGLLVSVSIVGETWFLLSSVKRVLECL